MALRRLHVTLGEKPLQVALPIAGKFGQGLLSGSAVIARTKPRRILDGAVRV
jgi:hypothetical protein